MKWDTLYVESVPRGVSTAKAFRVVLASNKQAGRIFIFSQIDIELKFILEISTSVWSESDMKVFGPFKVVAESKQAADICLLTNENKIKSVSFRKFSLQQCQCVL